MPQSLLVVAVRTPDGVFLSGPVMTAIAANPSPTPQRSVAGMLLACQMFVAARNMDSLLRSALEMETIAPSAQTERRSRGTRYKRVAGR